MKLSDAEIASLLFDEQGSDPATPPTGFWRVYTKATGLFLIDDTGTVTGPFSVAGYTPGGTDVAVADGGTGASTASGARTNLGLVIGTDVAAIASPTFTGEPVAPSFQASGKTGATATPIRLAGGTASGAPASGAHLKGEIVWDDTGVGYYCTVAGTPGTWVSFGGGGGGSVSDTAYGSGWNGDTTVAPSKNAVYDKIETLAPRIKKTTAVRTSGDITLNQTAITTVDTGLDLVIAAVAGDIIQVEMDSFIDNQSVFTNFDAYTWVSGAAVNPLGSGLSASLASTTGVNAWRVNSAVSGPLNGGPPPYVVQAGDISGGTVTLRLRYAQNATTSRTLFANANTPFKWWVKNFGTP